MFGPDEAGDFRLSYTFVFPTDLVFILFIIKKPPLYEDNIHIGKQLYT